MKWVNTDNKIPIKSWCENLEDSALEQAANLANHPVVVKHVALMPDAHLGYGMCIGGVIGCRRAVIPNCVGSDIGCGMIAVQTDYDVKNITVDQIKEMMGNARKAIPTGFKHHKEQQDWSGWADAPKDHVIDRELDSAAHQLGTLGGGNHFIEIQAGDDDNIWLMIHSGSRNFGKKIADYYNSTAVRFCKKWHSNIPNYDLAFLPQDDELFAEYMSAMNFALRFAAESRNRMMGKMKGIAGDTLKCHFGEEINIHHNYAAMEHHFGQNLVVHRKGATSARKGEKGIIPGSMGTPSYIVEGLGNDMSFQSCSHGAGRAMGRKDASRRFTVEECDKAMEGVVFGRWGKDRKGKIDLGETPQAYKDIDMVIEAQRDLIKPLVKLRPLGVVKG